MLSPPHGGASYSNRTQFPRLATLRCSSFTVNRRHGPRCGAMEASAIWAPATLHFGPSGNDVDRELLVERASQNPPDCDNRETRCSAHPTSTRAPRLRKKNERRLGFTASSLPMSRRSMNKPAGHTSNTARAQAILLRIHS